MYIEIIKALKERAKEMLEDNYKRRIGDEEIYTIICELENFYTAYEKQNKIIDLMARDLKTPVNSKEWIIEYYKKRCEDAKD